MGRGRPTNSGAARKVAAKPGSSTNGSDHENSAKTPANKSVTTKPTPSRGKKEHVRLRETLRDTPWLTLTCWKKPKDGRLISPMSLSESDDDDELSYSTPIAGRQKQPTKIRSGTEIPRSSGKGTASSNQTPHNVTVRKVCEDTFIAPSRSHQAESMSVRATRPASKTKEAFLASAKKDDTKVTVITSTDDEEWADTSEIMGSSEKDGPVQKTTHADDKYSDEADRDVSTPGNLLAKKVGIPWQDLLDADDLDMGDEPPTVLAQLDESEEDKSVIVNMTDDKGLSNRRLQTWPSTVRRTDVSEGNESPKHQGQKGLGGKVCAVLHLCRY